MASIKTEKLDLELIKLYKEVKSDINWLTQFYDITSSFTTDCYCLIFKQKFLK